MNRHLRKVMISIMVAFVVAAVFLAACGGKPATKPATPPSPAPTTPPPTATPPKIDPAVLRAKGEEIYQKTAGGVGCKSCHGVDGKGTNLGPDVRGKPADDIKRALGGDAMSFIYLSDNDIKAVAAYLEYLQSQP